MPPLSSACRCGTTSDLIDRKLAGAEKSHLAGADLSFHEAEYLRLVSELETSAANSRLPESPSAKDALNDLLVQLRLTGANGGNWRS
jgi:hypothetical protein